MKIKKQEIKDENKDESVEIDNLKNQLARALADYDNLEKRVTREREELYKSGSLRLVIRLLSIIDMLESAIAHTKDAGLAITLQQFKDILKQEGYEEISVKVGDEFDENTAEVIEILDAEVEKDGKIAEVLQSGWKYMDGSVVRHAKVKVYKTVENKV